VERRPSSGRCSDDSCYVFQSPGGAASSPTPLVVEGSRDPTQAPTAPAHTANLIQHCLLGRIWLDVLTVRAQPIAALDVAQALAVGAFVLMASRVRSPIARKSVGGNHLPLHQTSSVRSRSTFLRFLSCFSRPHSVYPRPNQDLFVWSHCDCQGRLSRDTVRER
jgi:hypothetical protein